MAKPLLSNDLWEAISALLPPPKPRRFNFPGRKPVDNRRVLTGILFVLKSGIPWEALPREMGCGSGMTCWRRLYEWQKAGVWSAIMRVLIERLPEADKIDWARSHSGRLSSQPQHRQPPPLPSLEREEAQPLPLPSQVSELISDPQKYAA